MVPQKTKAAAPTTSPPVTRGAKINAPKMNSAMKIHSIVLCRSVQIKSELNGICKAAPNVSSRPEGRDP